MGSSSGHVKRKTITLVFASSPLSTHGGAVSGGSWVRAPRSGQMKDHKIGICCVRDKHSDLRSKSKNWFVRNQDNVSEWNDKFICGLLFQ